MELMMACLLAKMDTNQTEMVARMMTKMDSQLEKMEATDFEANLEEI
jgi:hypothetical protein